LNALLGTPKGALGRSTLPAKSPYEVRNANNENEWEDNLNVKRRKVNQPWTVTRVAKEMPPWARTSDHPKGFSHKSESKTSLAGQRSLMVKEIIDITSDNEGGLTSDVTLPSTPAREPVPRTVPSEELVTKTPALQIPKPEITPRWEVLSSPPVSARNHLEIAVDTGPVVGHTRSHSTEITIKNTSLPDTEKSMESQRPKLASKAKPLRIAKSQSRSMLLCQNPSTAAARSQSLRNSQKTIETATGVEPEDETTLMVARRPRVNPFASLSDSDDDTSSKVVPQKDQPRGRERILPQMSAVGPSKGRAAALASDGTNRSSSPACTTMPPRPEHFELLVNSATPASLPLPATKGRQRMPAPCLESSEMEIMHGLMDQQPSAPSNAQVSTLKAIPPAFLSQLQPTAKEPFVPPSMPTVNSPFRRMQSESNANSNNDCLIVLSPIEETEPVAAVLRPSQEELLRKVPTRSKRASRKPLQRSMGLATGIIEKSKATTRGKAKQVEIVPEKRTEVGPWTVEATDLFEWKPPDWEERVKRRLKEFGF
jgi:hypothetical protein